MSGQRARQVRFSNAGIQMVTSFRGTLRSVPVESSLKPVKLRELVALHGSVLNGFALEERRREW
jgi:hypothetical protein